MTTRPNPHLAWTLIVDDPALRGTLHPCDSTPVGCERGHALFAALDPRHGYHQNSHSSSLFATPLPGPFDSSPNTDLRYQSFEPVAAKRYHDADAKRHKPKPQAQNPNSDSFVFVGRWPEQRGVDLITDIMTSLFSKMRCMRVTIRIGRRRSIPYNLSTLALPSILVDTATEN